MCLVVFCNCTSLRPPPRVTKCLTDFNRQGMDCINSEGTEFFIPFRSLDVNNHVCIPGKQFIDATAWIQEMIVVLTKGK